MKESNIDKFLKLFTEINGCKRCVYNKNYHCACFFTELTKYNKIKGKDSKEKIELFNKLHCQKFNPSLGCLAKRSYRFYLENWEN